jgi:hypothetical protein
MHFAHREYLHNRRVIPRAVGHGFRESIPKLVLPISEPASIDVRSVQRSNKPPISVVPSVGTKRFSKTHGIHGCLGADDGVDRAAANQY